MVDDAVASLLLNAFDRREVHYASQYKLEDQAKIDILAEQPGEWGRTGKQSLIRHAGLVVVATLPGTPFVIHTRHPVQVCGAQS